MKTGEGVIADIAAAFYLTAKEIVNKNGAWQVTTANGDVLIKEYQGELTNLQERLSWYDYLRKNGVWAVPELLHTEEQALIKEAGNSYYYAWHVPQGEPFSGRNADHLVAVVRAMAKLHSKAISFEEKKRATEIVEWQWPIQVQARLRDLLFFAHKMAERRLADDFQKVFLENFDFIYDQGQEAVQKIILANCKDSCQDQFIHLLASFLPEDIIVKENQAILAPNVLWVRGPKVQDLADFLRNYMGLHGWDPQLTYQLIQLYQEHNPLCMVEKFLLLSLMRFPARFWLYSCQYQKQNKSVTELTSKLINLIYEIRLRDHCLDKLDSLLCED